MSSRKDNKDLIEIIQYDYNYH